MNKIIITIALSFSVLSFSGCNNNKKTEQADFHVVRIDSLPEVLPSNKSDLTDKRLRLEAALKYAENELPLTRDEWNDHKAILRNRIMSKAGVVIDHKLPLDIRETGEIRMKGYVIKNISFQTLPGVHATANLYIPDGNGPFPGVINMLGHWSKGKIDNTGPQAVGHTLAAKGYVCLTIDPWGAGERGTRQGVYEYHGSYLGASLMNIGQPLIGIQISENIRGIDLLCSLAVVDSSRIGATGASGGGNQTMWLSAVDERVKADVPVVSVGTFESYIMESNCICEQLPDGLTFTEEAGVVALSNAPLLINHNKDTNPTFFPSEMLRSYNNAREIFKMEGKENSISYRRYDLPHGYEREDREAMLGWFDMQLRGVGNGEPEKEFPFTQVPEEKLLVFPSGERDADVISTDVFCIKKGNDLRSKYLKSEHFNVIQKEKELKDILGIKYKIILREVYHYSGSEGCDRLALETEDSRLLPLLFIEPAGESRKFVIVCNTLGKRAIPLSVINDIRKEGKGVVIVDLSGTGELTSTNSIQYDYTGKLHTLSRAELWLGRTILGEWVKELDLVTQFLRTRCNAENVSLDGSREAGLAGLFYAALGGHIDKVTLREAPVSYLFDTRDSVGFFSMGIHIPGFLVWGDVSLAAAVSGKDITFISPLTMSGTPLDNNKKKEYQAEYDKIRKLCRRKGKTTLL